MQRKCGCRPSAEMLRIQVISCLRAILLSPGPLQPLLDICYFLWLRPGRQVGIAARSRKLMKKNSLPPHTF